MKYLSAFDVAERLSCSYHKALKVIREAGATKIGALVRVEEAQLQSYLEKCRELARPVSTPDQAARGSTTRSTPSRKTAASAI